MASTNTEKGWQRDETEIRIAALCQKDAIWPAVIAARAALRAFPLIGIRKQFDFWIENTNKDITVKPRTKALNYDSQDNDSTQLIQDNRVYYLMASFYACRIVLQQASLPYEQRDRKKLSIATSAVAFAFGNASEAAYTAPDKIKTDYEAAVAVTDAITQAAAVARKTVNYTSKFAVKGTSETVEGAAAKELASAAIFAVNCVYDAVINANSGAFSDIDIAFLHDLKAAESAASTHSVINSPLWSGTQPGEVGAVKTIMFQPAVEALISEISDTRPDSAKALAQMLKLYDRYLSGVTTDEENGVSKETLYEALNKISAEEVNADRDTLNRGALVNGLASILCDKEHTHPLTIGLMGNWGSGKSQVLALLKKELKDRDCTQPFLFGEFNAWAYEHAKSSQAAMAHEVISALTSRDSLKPLNEKGGFLARLARPLSNLYQQCTWVLVGRVRLVCAFAIHKHLSKVLQSIGWFILFVMSTLWLANHGLSKDQLIDISKVQTGGVLLALLTSLWQLAKKLRDIISQPMTKEFLTYIKLPNYASHIGDIAEMQKDIRLMAKIRLGFKGEASHDYSVKQANSRRLLFVVDDLDRCSPQGIVKTFEAIRLILHIPHVTVVVAVDQRIALAALALHYKGIEPYHTLQDARAIARDYLAKVIQLPVVVSDGDNESLTEFLSDIWLEEGNSKQKWLAHLIEDGERQEQTERRDLETRSSKPYKQGVDLDTKADVFSENELAKLILEDEPKSEPQVLEGMSDHQKAALYYWATHFGLTNARQLKRLDNSYNLVRLVTDEEDKLALTETSNEVNKQHVKFSYGYLVTLMTLEFINSIEVTILRDNASRFLRKGDVDKLNCMANQQHKDTLVAARTIIQNAAEQLYPKTANDLHFDKLLRYVENFALPAIDGFDIDTETASSS